MIFQRHSIWVLAILSILVIGLSQCQQEPELVTEASYVNHNDTVAYVGINTCKQCHADIYQSFIETGMGSSFGEASGEKSAANFNEALLYDKDLDFYYYPHWQDSSLWLDEFRLKESDTSFFKQQHIDFIVGSGQHTNSHMYLNNGYLHQAPFTWYAQQSKLDLPPGFEEGANARFSRKIGLECTSCHNAMPTDFVMGSINKYGKVPGAIDCERCHGPGEIHVKRMKAGELVDTATEIDYSIVNVGKLAPEFQFEVCQRCHLQGNAVLAEGKSFMDFKPGMMLSEVMDVYLPRYSNSEDQFIMASHVDRFKQSKCLVNQPDQFNCTSCHNPHKSVKYTRIESFNSTCKNCHEPEPLHNCTEKPELIKAEGYNCVGCHMPLSSSTDIPHVSIHDHRIQIPKPPTDSVKIRKFLGLAAINNPNPTPRSKSLAYLQQYEKFRPNQWYLDSAQFFIDKLEKGADEFKLRVYYLFLSDDYQGVTQLVEQRGVAASLNLLSKIEYNNFDGWTAYRIAESHKKLGENTLALSFMEKAHLLMPYNLEVMNKQGSLYLAMGEKAEAERLFLTVLAEDSTQREALNNIGYVFLTKGDFPTAKTYFSRALAQDPDYVLAWLNLAAASIQLGEREQAQSAIAEVLNIEPANAKANAFAQYIKTLE